MMGANVFLAVRTALIYRPAVDRPQAQLVRELVDRVAGRVRRMDVDRLGPTVQEEKPAYDRAESPHGLRARRKTKTKHTHYILRVGQSCADE